MAFKFGRSLCTYHAMYDNGLLTVYLDKEDESSKIIFELPMINRKYSLQKNTFPSSQIQCALQNDDSVMILRFDGTLSIYTKDYKLIGFNNWNSKQYVYNRREYITGSIVIGDKDSAEFQHWPIGNVDIGPDNKFVYLELPGYEFPIKVDKSINEAYTMDLYSNVFGLPRLKFDNGIISDSAGKYTVIADVNKLDYPVDNRLSI